MLERSGFREEKKFNEPFKNLIKSEISTEIIAY